MYSVHDIAIKPLKLISLLRFLMQASGLCLHLHWQGRNFSFDFSWLISWFIGHVKSFGIVTIYKLIQRPFNVLEPTDDISMPTFFNIWISGIMTGHVNKVGAKMWLKLYKKVPLIFPD